MVVAVMLGIAQVFAGVDVHGFGDAIFHKIVCAVRGPGECLDDPTELDDAYGKEVAELVRKYRPNLVYESGTQALPVDFRVCRAPRCGDGDDLGGSIASSNAMYATTAFSRVLDFRKQGDGVYIQYWLYYGDSATAGLVARSVEFLKHKGVAQRIPRDPFGGVDKALGAYHKDDWEGVQVHLRNDGKVEMRASAHDGYVACREESSTCRDAASGWAQWTGWSRVSGGSHASQIVGGPGSERFTPAERLRVVPIESLRGREKYRFGDAGEISAPWMKYVYDHPQSNSTSRQPVDGDQ